MVDRIETYDGIEDVRRSYIRDNTLLRQEFGSRGISDPTTFALRLGDPSNPHASGVSFTFTPGYYFVTEVIGNKVVIRNADADEYQCYILYFYSARAATDFHKYVSVFSMGKIRCPPLLKTVLETGGSLPWKKLRVWAYDMYRIWSIIIGSQLSANVNICFLRFELWKLLIRK